MWPFGPLVYIFDFFSDTMHFYAIDIFWRMFIYIGCKLNIFYMQFFFVRICWERWPPWHLIMPAIFLTFPLQPFNEFNNTWQEARILRPLSTMCFWFDPFTQMAAQASDWLRTLRFSTAVERALTKLTGLIGWSFKRSLLPVPLIGWGIFDFSSNIQGTLAIFNREQELSVLYKVCVCFF